MIKKEVITVEAGVKAPLSKVWECWTKPNHIVNWAFASDKWEAPFAENDLVVGGKFRTTMSAKDKSASFDFTGVYTTVTTETLIEYELEDGRCVRVEFVKSSNKVLIKETFDPDSEGSSEQQKLGWQAILNNFKKYVENSF